jgi:chitinase
MNLSTGFRAHIKDRFWPLLWISLLLQLLSVPAQAGLWITGYYPGYEISQMAPSNIDFTTITHVIHFSLVPQADGSLDNNANGLTPSACANVVSLAHAAGRQALVCVGGAGTEDDFLEATTSAYLGDFITNLVTFMSAYGYDGIDLDWEPFLSTDADQYTDLVNGLRAALDQLPGHKLLTVAAPAYPSYGDSPTAEFTMLASVQGQLDQINVMTYDLSGPYSGWVTWFNSPLYDGGYTFPNTSELVPSVGGAVSNFLNNGVASAKLGIGLPFYGYIWTGGPGVTQPRQAWPATNTPTVTTSAYAALVGAYYKTNLYHWDTVAQAAYLSITNSPASADKFISYDDAESCETKISFARNLHLGGIMIWELSQDYTSTEPAGQRTPLEATIKEALATPDFTGIQMNVQTVALSFTSIPLGLYRILWSSNLYNSTWNTLTNNVNGTGPILQLTDPMPATNAMRFYRVQTPP